MLIKELNLFLSEGRTVVKCVSECNQSGRRIVFGPEPVAMSTTVCASSVVVSAALRHESHSPCASKNLS